MTPPEAQHLKTKSISRRLIALTALPLAGVIALISTLNAISTRERIDNSIARLRATVRDAIREGGREQLQLLSHSTRVLLLLNDYSTLQTVVGDMARQRRFTAMVISNNRGLVVAHSDRTRVGKPASTLGDLDPTRAGERIATVGGRRSLVLAQAVSHDGQKLGAVLLATSLTELDAALARARALRAKNIRNSVIYTSAIGLLALIIGAGLAVWLGVRITRPIRQLADHANRVADGDLEIRATVGTRDEIGVLAERFNHMTERVSVLLLESAAKVALEKELELASAVQATIVPGAQVHSSDHLSVAGHFRPAARCSGDFWAYQPAEDGRVLIVIGDATGHGVGPAMLTAVAKGALTAFMRRPAAQISAAAVLDELGAAVAEATGSELRVTALALLFQADGKGVDVANAGHRFPYLVGGDREVKALVARGRALGSSGSGGTKPTPYKEISHPLVPGDSVVLFTDGLLECQRADGEEYGQSRLREAIEGHAGKGAAALRDELVADLDTFRGNAAPGDDVTLVVARVLGAP
ncbi:MAG: SpoIIE family protein phosphatase [Myxococcales bacterium]|nr:SpoIIE family protein phosphatase [Myxococcales bacterium]